MPNIFFIGDTHFGHTNILEFEKEYRPFSNIEEHDEELIKRWNSVVKDDDIVYHLGDVILGPSSCLKHLTRLRGIKKLVLGNHDRHKNLKPYFYRFYGALKMDRMILTHIPIHRDSIGKRFLANVHGHLHSKTIDDPVYINVSCEQINLTPISYEDLQKRFKDVANM